jgi:hypothetical protein
MRAIHGDATAGVRFIVAESRIVRASIVEIDTTIVAT